MERCINIFKQNSSFMVAAADSGASLEFPGPSEEIYEASPKRPAAHASAGFSSPGEAPAGIAVPSPRRAALSVSRASFAARLSSEPSSPRMPKGDSVAAESRPHRRAWRATANLRARQRLPLRLYAQLV